MWVCWLHMLMWSRLWKHLFNVWCPEAETWWLTDLRNDVRNEWSFGHLPTGGAQRGHVGPPAEPEEREEPEERKEPEEKVENRLTPGLNFRGRRCSLTKRCNWLATPVPDPAPPLVGYAPVSPPSAAISWLRPCRISQRCHWLNTPHATLACSYIIYVILLK